MSSLAKLPLKTTFVFLASLFALSGFAYLLAEAGDTRRLGANLLVAAYGLLGLGLGCVVLLALFSVTGACWSDQLLPVATRLTRLLPVGAVGIALVLITCPSLYPWTSAASDAGSPFQAAWLSRPFFLLRALVYLTLWLGLGFLVLRASRRQDAQPPDESRGVSAGISAAFLVVFAVTSWLASVDWIMSLEPKWSSTVFGIYNFAGMFLGTLAAVIIAALWLNFRGKLAGGLTRDCRRDLGTLLFAFSSFWMYIWFSQYLLIWYVNNPEEAEYYVLRQQECWQPLFIVNVVLGWGVPFVVLLFRSAKESSLVLMLVALVVLAGRWVDLYLMILPPVTGARAVVEGWDAGILLPTVALGALIVACGPQETARRAGEIP
jgi:hypothetical protein